MAEFERLVTDVGVSPVFSGMRMVQRQAEPARHRKLAMLFLLPALRNNNNNNSQHTHVNEKTNGQNVLQRERSRENVCVMSSTHFLKMEVKQMLFTVVKRRRKKKGSERVSVMA